MNIAIGCGILLLVVGIAVLICCLVNVAEFFEFRQSAMFDDLFGRTGARIFYGVWGSVLVVLGTGILVAVLLKSSGLVKPRVPAGFQKKMQEKAQAEELQASQASQFLAQQPTELPAGFTIRLPKEFTRCQVSQMGSPELWRMEQRWSDESERFTILADVYGGPGLYAVPPIEYKSGRRCEALLVSARERVFGSLEGDFPIPYELTENKEPGPAFGYGNVLNGHQGKTRTATVHVIHSRPYIVVLAALADSIDSEHHARLLVSLRTLDTSKARIDFSYLENGPGQQNLLSPADKQVLRRLSGDISPDPPK